MTFTGVDMLFGRKLQDATQKVLETLVKNKNEWSYGYEIAKEAGVSEDTVYRLFAKLQNFQLTEVDEVKSHKGANRKVARIRDEYIDDISNRLQS